MSFTDARVPEVLPRVVTRFLLFCGSLTVGCVPAGFGEMLVPLHPPPDMAPLQASREVTPVAFGPRALGLSGAYLYVASDSPGEHGGIWRVPRVGGPATKVVSGVSAWHLAVDASTVAWFDPAPGLNWFDGPGSLQVRALEGGPVRVVATGQYRTMGLVLDGGYAYWTAAGREGATGWVARAPVDGGPTEVLASGAVNAGGLAVDDAFVYWIDRGPFGSRDYLRDYDDGKVLRCPKGGGATEVLADGIDGPLNGITLGASEVYVVTGAEGEASGNVYRIPKTGGRAVTLSPDQSNLEPLVRIGDRVVWSSEDATTAGIWTVPIAGGAVKRLTADRARDMVVDGTSLYFIDGQGRIRETTLP